MCRAGAGLLVTFPRSRLYLDLRQIIFCAQSLCNYFILSSGISRTAAMVREIHAGKVYIPTGMTPPSPSRRPRAAEAHKTPAPSKAPATRAWVRLPSGKRLDLLNPTPLDWEDEDLAIGLARTYRWGGHSAWPLPLSVAQHSLFVLALHRLEQAGGDPRADLRELLHDADEGLLGFDCISVVKPFLRQGIPETHRAIAKSRVSSLRHFGLDGRTKRQA